MSTIPEGTDGTEGLPPAQSKAPALRAGLGGAASKPLADAPGRPASAALDGDQLSALRAEFPVFQRHCYLNAGTDGPLPAVALAAASAELQRELREGRSGANFLRRHELAEQLRERYARLLGCNPADLALTTCTSEGASLVISGLGLQAGDEILTSDEEHPGLLGSLQAARDLRGAQIRMAPLAEIAEAIGPRTKLIACSQVSWVSGELAPAALAERPAGVSLLLDGAQALGAVASDVSALRCDAYAGSSQKWLCGPDGLGMLYVSAELRERLEVTRRPYGSFIAPDEGLDAALKRDAARFDAYSLAAAPLAMAIAAFDLFESWGFERLQRAAHGLAGELAGELERAGRTVRKRGATTLVSFGSNRPEAERERLGAAGVIVRDLPGHPLLRASIGPWNDEHDLRRLLDALGADD